MKIKIPTPLPWEELEDVLRPLKRSDLPQGMGSLAVDRRRQYLFIKKLPFLIRTISKNPNGCWISSYKKNRHGRIVFRIDFATVNPARIIFSIFRRKSPGELCVCHTCDVGECVNPDHMFLGTRADNANDMKSKGRSPNMVGDLNGARKLCGLDIIEIRRLLDLGYSQSEIAKEFRVCQSNISKIKNHTWKRLK